MADKKKGGDIDFDIDNMDDLDWPDFDFDDAFEEPKDDRSPARKVASTAMKSAGKVVADPARIRNVLTKTLPGAYSDAAGVGFDAAKDMKGIFDANMSEVTKTKQDLQRSLRRTLPKIRGSVPDKLGKVLDKLAGEEEYTHHTKSKEQERSDDISSKLDEIMGVQNDQNVAKEEVGEARRLNSEVTSRKRFTTQMAAFSSMDTSLRQIRDYNEGIDARWKRKSLEMQMNQNFMMADLVDNATRTAADTLNRLDLIVKNTALPEAVKITKSEEFGRLTQQRILGQVSNALSGGLGDYLSKSATNMKGRVTRNVADKLRGVREGFRDASGMAGDMVQMSAEQKAAGGEDDTLQTLLDLGLGAASDWATNKYGDGIKAGLGKHERLNSKQGWFRNLMTNGGAMLDEEAGKRSNDGSFLGFFKDLGRSMLHSTKIDPSLKNNDLQQGHMPDNFNQLSNRSIIDVIPGLLSRIHHEVVKFRTGDDAVPMIRYDAMTGQFTDSKSMVKRVVGNFMTEGQEVYNNEGLDKIIKQIDPEGALDADGRKALQRHLIELNMRNRKFDIKGLAQGGQVYGNGSAAGKASLRSHMEKVSGLQIDGSFSQSSEEINSREADVGNMIKAMRNNFQDPMPMIRTLVDAGYKEELLAAGLLVDKGGRIEVDMDKVGDLRLGQGGLGSDFGDKAYSPKGRANFGGGKGAGNKAVHGLSQSLRDFTAQQANAQALGGPQTINYELMGSTLAKALAENKGANDDCCGPVDEYLDKLDKIIAALGSMNDTYNSGYQTMVLEEIMDIMSDGRQFANVKVTDDLFIVGGKQLGSEAGLWKDRLKRAGNRVGGHITNARNFVKGRLTSARAHATKALAFGQEKFGQVTKFADNLKGQVVDIYVKGWERAALEARKLEAGAYRDKVTGKIIKKLSDIKGEVEELMEDGTTRVVLSLEDIKAGLHDRFGKRIILGAFKSIKDTADLLMGKAAGRWGELATKLRKGLTDAKDWAWGKLAALHDVYIEGEAKPRLLKFVLESGGYFDAKTGDVIRKLSDIKGDIKDAQGNIVLTLDDMRKGLMDQYGNKLRDNWSTALAKVTSGFDRAKNFGKSVTAGIRSLGTGLMKKARGMGTWALDKLSGISGKFKNWLNTDAPANDILSAQLQVQMAILEQISQLNPANQRRRIGDSDGDGVIDGSWQDITRKRNHEKEVKGERLEGPGKTGNGKELALIGALGEKLKGFLGKDKEEDEDGFSLSDAADASELGRHGKGIMGKLGRGAKWVGRGLKRIPGVKGAGRLLGKIPGMQAAGRFIAANGVRAAVGTGLRAAGGFALRGLIGAGAVAAGVVSAPVAAIAATVIGVATLGWMAYKWYDASKDRPLQKLRLMQYGWDGKDSDVAKKLLAFEEKLLKHAKVDGGKLNIDAGGDDALEALKEFDIDASKPKDLKFRNFQEWFDKRFRSVFSVWMVALDKLKLSASLPELDDKLSAENKKTLLDVVKSAGKAAWGVAQGPMEQMDMLTDDSIIEAQAKAAGATFDKEAPTTNAKTQLPLPEAGAAALAASAYPGQPVAGAEAANATGQDGVGVGTLTKVNTTAAVIAAATQLAGSNSGAGGTMPTNTSGGGPDFPAGLLPKTALDALRTIRMRAYGLTQLDTNVVSALLYLEWAALKKTKAQSDGSADYTGTLEELIDMAGPRFHIGQPGSASYEGFKAWLDARFLPTWKAYVGALKAISGNVDPLWAHERAKPEEQYKLAEAVIGAGAYYQNTYRSVWSIPLSPVPGEVGNPNASTVADNMKSLIKSVEKQRLDEVAGEAGKIKSSNLSETKGFFAGIGDSVSKFFGGGDDTSTSGSTSSGSGNWFTNMFKGDDKRPAGGTIADTMQGSKGDLYNTSGSGGTPGTYNPQAGGGVNAGNYDPNGGPGGNVNDLPMPTGPKGFEEHKDLIAAVAKMTGMDPAILAGLLATESNFNSGVRNKKGSATGLGQFIDSTWDSMIKKYGKMFGIRPGTPATDARANALMTVMYMKDNAAALKTSLGRTDLTDVDLYNAHFLGASGYAKAMKNLDAVGPDLMPREAKNNPTIFWVDGDRNRPRTMRQILELQGNKQIKNRNKYGAMMNAYLSSKGEKVNDSLLKQGDGVIPSTPQQTASASPGSGEPDTGQSGEKPTPSAATLARAANSGGSEISTGPAQTPEMLKVANTSGGGSSGGGGGGTESADGGMMSVVPSPSDPAEQAKAKAAQASANNTATANTMGGGSVDKLVEVGNKQLQVQQQMLQVQQQMLQVLAAQANRPGPAPASPMSVKAPQSV